MHSFLLIFFLVPAIWVAQGLHLPWRKIGTFSIFAALTGMAIFGVFDFLGQNHNAYENGFGVQRYTLSLASSYNLPLLQCFFVGLIWMFMGRQAGGSLKNLDSETTNHDPPN